MTENLKLADCYPYTYVRVATMKAKLLNRDDYNKLLKMSFAEITKFLQDSEYKKEINELAMELSGADLLEAALNKNLISSFNKLLRISPDELDLLINAHLRRYDYYNIKSILRGKFANLSNEAIKKMLIPIGLNSGKFYEKLIEETSIQKMLESSKLLEKKLILHLVKELEDTNSLSLIENSLDKAYFNYAFEFSEKIPEQGQLFKVFILNEIDMLNIKLLLRMKKGGVTEKQLSQHICMFGSELNKRILKQLLKLDYKDTIKELEKTSFKKIIKKHKEALLSGASLVEFENDLDKYLLSKSLLLLHQNPLSIDIIIGYMFAKEVELMNLKTIVKSRQLGLKEDFISKQLIVT
ncbi:ATP synthase A1 subunit C [Candidatus Woesearchaeota archaeon]|nr:ATP synthase A1 subunit C [Candidatus Woesearchaeota archaeon]